MWFSGGMVFGHGEQHVRSHGQGGELACLRRARRPEQPERRVRMKREGGGGWRGGSPCPNIQMGKESSERLDGLPEATQLGNRGTWLDSDSY